MIKLFGIRLYSLKEVKKVSEDSYKAGVISQFATCTTPKTSAEIADEFLESMKVKCKRKGAGK